MDKRKYIIELPDDEHLISWWTYTGTEDGKQHTDFREVVKTPYKEPDLEAIKQEAYQRGLNDAWQAARKIVLSREDGGLFCYEERKAVFGCGNYMALKMFLAPEAIEKIRQYEHEVKAGNEVNGKCGRGVITKIGDDGDHFNVMWENGSTGYYMIGDFKKTGRNFPEIAEVLRKMQEEKE